MHALRMNLRLGQRVFADDARERTAKLLDSFQPALVSRLMNYEIENGARRSITGFPAVQFTSLSDGFSLVGFGDLGRDLLMDAADSLAHAWSRELGRHVGLDSQSIACVIEPRAYALRYTVPRFVVQKRPEHREWAGDPVRGRALFEGLFIRSIQRQCEFLGIEMPEGMTAQFVGAEGEFGARNGAGRPACLGLRGAVFDVNAKLSGIWSVGRLLSKGYGHFNAHQQLGGIYADGEGGHALSE